MRATLLLLLATLACGGKPDECERAFARVARISAARSEPWLSGRHADEALEGCRRAGRTAKLDPVLRCAMDAATDDAAAQCIDQFVKAVIVPTGEPRGDGSGINPLLLP